MLGLALFFIFMTAVFGCLKVAYDVIVDTIKNSIEDYKKQNPKV